MKKYYYSLAILLFSSFLFIPFSCDLFDTEDDCDKDDKPHISRTFNVSVQIKYKDGVPFEGKTEFFIVKERCNGTQSGYFKTSGSPDGTGKYSPSVEATYSFNNARDKVFFQFTAYHTPYYPPSETTEVAGATFNYDKAKTQADDYDEITETYYITIPTNSDGTE